MPTRKPPTCQVKSKTTGRRCQRAAVYRASNGRVLVCGTHARNYGDAVRLGVGRGSGSSTARDARGASSPASRTEGGMADHECDGNVKRLQAALGASVERWSGSSAVGQRLLELLARCWQCFGGHDSHGMEARKLRRIEWLDWTPPASLSFTIERHGGTVMGSTRAAVQHWEADLVERTAQVVGEGRRQLSSMAKPLELNCAVARVVEAVRSHAKPVWLEWRTDTEVRVNVRRLLDEVGARQANFSSFKQTEQGRQRGLRDLVLGALEREGWRPRGRNWYARA